MWCVYIYKCLLNYRWWTHYTSVENSCEFVLVTLLNSNVPFAIAGLASRLLDMILLRTFGVGGVAFRTPPYVGTYEWLKLTCEWFGDSGVTGVTVVWLICVSGVWLWLWLEWLWFKCIWLMGWFMYWTGGDIVLIGACNDKFKLIGVCRVQVVFSFCQTKTLWTIAQPQNTMPIPISTLVTIAGIKLNWVNVYRIIPEMELFDVKKNAIQQSLYRSTHQLKILVSKWRIRLQLKLGLQWIFEGTCFRCNRKSKKILFSNFVTLVSSMIKFEGQAAAPCLKLLMCRSKAFPELKPSLTQN